VFGALELEEHLLLAEIEGRWARATKPLDILPNGAALDGEGKLAYRLVYATSEDREAILKASQDVGRLLAIIQRLVKER